MIFFGRLCKYIKRIGAKLNMVRPHEEIEKDAHRFIFSLGDIHDEKVFQVQSMDELGKYYFQTTLHSVNGLTEDILKSVIKRVAFRRSEPKGITDYYTSICKIAFIEKIPGPILNDVRQKYDEIFVVPYSRVKAQIAAAIQAIDQKIQRIEDADSKVKNKAASISRGSFIKDIEADYAKVRKLANELRLLETERESITKNDELLEAFFLKFCDFHDPISTEEALRNTALRIARDHGNSTDEIFTFFEPYSIWLDAIEDNVIRPYALFYKVKQSPFIDAFEREYRIKSFRNPEEAKKEIKKQIDSLPGIDDLFQLKQRDPNEYFIKLQAIISDYMVISQISALINSNPTLHSRRDLLQKTIDLYEHEEYELFANLAPVQMEGIISDYLYDELTFRRFSDLAFYPRAVLREKLDLLNILGTNISQDAIVYFYYSFNNIIRNNIAHGAFEALYYDEIQVKAFAAEILLDMFYLVRFVSNYSETAKMINFVHGYIDYYNKVIKAETVNQHFGALFNDLIGAKTIMCNGMFEKYRPLQVVYWLLNPTYEKVYTTVNDKKDLLELRQSLLSVDFWNYVYEKLNEIIGTGYDFRNINPEFASIVKGLFTCGVEPDVRLALVKVNAQLTQINNFSEA